MGRAAGSARASTYPGSLEQKRLALTPSHQSRPSIQAINPGPQSWHGKVTTANDRSSLHRLLLASAALSGFASSGVRDGGGGGVARSSSWLGTRAGSGVLAAVAPHFTRVPGARVHTMVSL